MPSFAQMKRDREKVFTQLNKQIADNGRGGPPKDERFWYPSVDATGNGFAVIRFLPAPGDEPVPYVSMWSYGFKDRGGWYIENSRTTLGLGEKDPVHESNKALRADGTKASKAIADKRKASQSYFMNIYIVRDPSNPENEGKVKLFRCGNQIFKRIQAKMNPEFEGEEKMNPFDLWEGANFRLKIVTKKTPENPKGFRNYENSEWDQPGPLDADDSKMEAIWKSEHPLQELIAPDKFKTYDELKARFELVTGERSGGESRTPRQSAPEPDAGPSTRDRFANRTSQQAPTDEEVPWNTDDAGGAGAGGDDDEDLAYYQSLLNK